jgi:hypothetical protein
MTVIDLGTFRRDRAADAAAQVVVERGESPDNPAVSYYKISGPSRAAVQSEIDGLKAEVESFGAGGYGIFLNPERGGDGRYYSVGKVEAYVDDDVPEGRLTT